MTPHPDWMREGVGYCGNCGRMEVLYRWVTTEGQRGVSCAECAAEYGWFVPEAPSHAEGRDGRNIRTYTPDVFTHNPDAFGKWVVRGIAIGIGLLIVEIPLALIAVWWLNHQLSKVGL